MNVPFSHFLLEKQILSHREVKHSWCKLWFLKCLEKGSMKPILLHKCQPISIYPPTFLNSIPDAVVFKHYCLCCTSFFFVKPSSHAFHLQRSILSGYRGCSQHTLNNVGLLDCTVGENSCCAKESFLRFL